MIARCVLKVYEVDAALAQNDVFLCQVAAAEHDRAPNVMHHLVLRSFVFEKRYVVHSNVSIHSL